ncbi:hypothetical protein RvY_09257 [Ramazzottius varieornatus]|uniref:Spaetzle domain-containing protein n=1 Tax=Ramazzottius varieornatus TaxID=947166 RepID=A0A1D1V8P2_RAMVA|nr:hypothetical protein RvY_09257 [Ramazzottius varieornatus]
MGTLWRTPWITPIEMLTLLLVNILSFAMGDMFNLGGSASSDYLPRMRPDFDLNDIPCDMRDTPTCNRPGKAYPWYGMQNYIRDNGGFIKRMYGDARFDRGPSKVRAQGPVTSSSTDRMSRKDDGVNACPSEQFVMTPFWANNSDGRALAVVNFHPFEQAIQQEICKSGVQGRCRDGCVCEQKYAWYRLLAFDPTNECKGIFMDWFQFPSCCTCRCYDLVSREVPITAPSIIIAVQSKNSSVVNQEGKSDPDAIIEPKIGSIPSVNLDTGPVDGTSLEDDFSITAVNIRPSTRNHSTTSTTSFPQFTTVTPPTTTSVFRRNTLPEVQATSTSSWHTPVNTTMFSTSTSSSTESDLATGSLFFPLNVSSGSKVISAELVQSSSPRSVVNPRKAMGSGLPNRLRYLTVPQTKTSTSLPTTSSAFPVTDDPLINSTDLPRTTSNVDTLNHSTDNNIISIFVEQEPSAQKKMEQSVRSNRIPRM